MRDLQEYLAGPGLYTSAKTSDATGAKELTLFQLRVSNRQASVSVVHNLGEMFLNK